MKNKNKKLYLLIVLVLTISIGYAALASNLKINGTSGVKNASWIIHWTNPQVVPGSVTDTKPVLSENNTNATWNVTLTEPGDFYEFTIDAVNEGTIDAEVVKIKSKFDNSDGDDITSENLPAYLEYEVTYADEEHTPIAVSDSLDHGQTRKYRVRVAYSEDVNPGDLEDEDITTSFYFEVEYKQKEKETPPTKTVTVTRQTEGQITACDTVKIKSGDYEENFKVLSVSSEKLSLITDYCIDDEGNQTSGNNYLKMRFANDNYWTGSYVGEYVFNEQSLLYPVVDAYKDKLTGKGVNVLKARLLSYDEGRYTLNCIKNNQYYWTGSARDASYMVIVRSDGSYDGGYYVTNAYCDNGKCGVRPVIEIPITEITN